MFGLLGCLALPIESNLGSREMLTLPAKACSLFIGPLSLRTKAYNLSLLPLVNARPTNHSLDALAFSGIKLADGVPLAVSSGSVITAYDPTTGSQLWQKDLKQEFHRQDLPSVSYILMIISYLQMSCPIFDCDCRSDVCFPVAAKTDFMSLDMASGSSSNINLSAYITAEVSQLTY